jgi:hypothetical protein
MLKNKKTTKSTSAPKPIVGIGWYSESQWIKLCRVAVDPEVLKDTYEKWVEVFNKGCADLDKAGISVVKVPVDVEELIQWCRENSLEITGESRSKYITEKLRRSGDE